MFKCASVIISASIVSLALSACAKLPENFSDAYNEGFYSSMTPSDDAMETAKVHFHNGDYGIAARHYKQAVEKNPNNAEAWLGLAASYDRLRRFDNANKAYDVLVKLVGFTPTVLNNLGYHYFLRGDMENARKTLLAAQQKAPDNHQIQNNIALLNENQKHQGLAVRNGG